MGPGPMTQGPMGALFGPLGPSALYIRVLGTINSRYSGHGRPDIIWPIFLLWLVMCLQADATGCKCSQHICQRDHAEK